LRIAIFGVNLAFTGVWMLRVAQGWLVLQLTGSGVALGVVYALMYLPMLLVGSWSGVIADRYPKRHILYCTASAMGAVAALLGLLDIAGVLQLWEVYVLVILFGTVSAIDQPTRLSFVVELVDPELLPNAVALNSASANAARLVGPALAGVIISASGTGWAILLYAVSVLPLIVLLSRMRRSELHAAALVVRAKGQFRAGVQYVREHAELRIVFVTILVVGTFGLTQDTLLPLMARHEFHGGAGMYSIFALSLAVGTFAGRCWRPDGVSPRSGSSQPARRHSEFCGSWPR
jgi:MFS family permease